MPLPPQNTVLCPISLKGNFSILPLKHLNFSFKKKKIILPITQTSARCKSAGRPEARCSSSGKMPSLKLSLASVPYTELNLRSRDLILGEVLIEKNSFITLPGKGDHRGLIPSKPCIPAGVDSEEFHSNGPKRVWSVRGHSSDWLVVR